jgi:hypothetical protein
MSTTLHDNKVALQERIVAAAVLAPSAENVQPWHFRSNGDELQLCLDRDRMLASDVDQMLAFTGLGASLENAVIAARELGFEPDVTIEKLSSSSLRPAHTQGRDRFLPVATLSFDRPGAPDSLFASIESRCTCRRMDGRRPVGREPLARMAASTDQFPSVRLDWLTERRIIGDVAKLVGLGNRIRFEHEPFHRELYDNLRFTNDEVKRTRDGLDLETLQLPIGVASVMSVLRKWLRMRMANQFGFSRGVARQAAKEVRCSGAVGLLSVDRANVDSFVAGGRALQRIWLTATSLGLGLHPTASLPVFLAYTERTDMSQLQPPHAQMAGAMRDRFFHLFPSLRGRTVQMTFRVGHAWPPAVRSLRRPVSAVLNFESKESDPDADSASTAWESRSPQQ